mgnify:FL=1
MILGNFSRLLETTGALVIEATEIALDVRNVVFKTGPDDVRMVSRGRRITWKDGSGQCETGSFETRPGKARKIPSDCFGKMRLNLGFFTPVISLIAGNGRA